MSENTIMMLRLPRALKAQVDAEAKRFGITTSDLIRKKLQAVTLPKAPVVRMLEGRIEGHRLLRIEVPIEVPLAQSGATYRSPREVKRKVPK